MPLEKKLCMHTRILFGNKKNPTSILEAYRNSAVVWNLPSFVCRILVSRHDSRLKGIFLRNSYGTDSKDDKKDDGILMSVEDKALNSACINDVDVVRIK